MKLLCIYSHLEENMSVKLANLIRLLCCFCLATFAHSTEAFAVTVQDLQARTYTDANGKTLPYRLFVPANYDATKQYPLIVFLHGAGERGDDNAKQLANSGPLVFVQPSAQVKNACFLIAPQCPTGQQWVNTPWGKGSYSTKDIPISDPLRMTLECIQGLQKEFSIDSKRLYATGLSMGGYGTWDLILRNPTMFAAAIPICGAGDPNLATPLKGTSIWSFHSADDKVVPASGSRDMMRALWASGQTPSYTEYTNYGHSSWNAAYGTPDLVRWMFSFQR
jgi:predicted peptidase